MALFYRYYYMLRFKNDAGQDVSRELIFYAEERKDADKQLEEFFKKLPNDGKTYKSEFFKREKW